MKSRLRRRKKIEGKGGIVAGTGGREQENRKLQFSSLSTNFSRAVKL